MTAEPSTCLRRAAQRDVQYVSNESDCKPGADALDQSVLIRVSQSELESHILPCIDQISWSEASVRKERGNGFYNTAAERFCLTACLSRHSAQDAYESLRFKKLEAAVYGVHLTARKTRIRWLQLAASIICVEDPLGIVQAYRSVVSKNGLSEELKREVLIYIVSVSSCCPMISSWLIISARLSTPTIGRY